MGICGRGEFCGAYLSLPYRMKGFALVGEKRFFVNHTCRKTEWREIDESGPTKLAFVGWQLSEEQIVEALNVCLADDQ